MITCRPCVNGVLAAVLSASFLPVHGALAKEKTPAAQKHAAKSIAKKPEKPSASPKEDATKTDSAAPAAGDGSAGEK